MAGKLFPGLGAGGRSRRVWTVLLLAALTLGAVGCAGQTARLQADEEADQEKFAEVPTVGDVTAVANLQPTPVSGVGLVTGLDGTGGGNPPGHFRTMLENELRKRQVQNVKEVLESPDNALVLVSAVIPPGIRKGDPIDVEVTLPPGSKVTSLRGGYLQLCNLHSYNSTHSLKPDYQGSDKLLLGHILARAKGPLLVGLGARSEDEGRLRKARIWQGGVSLIDTPYFLVLNNDQKFARVANAVAERINTMFHDDARKRQHVLQHRRLFLLDEVTSQINGAGRTPLGRGELAKAVNRDVIHVRVPWDYRFNPERYIRILRLIPLRETAEGRGPYRQKLQEMLLDPARTVRAAYRLEALGKESIPALKAGLKSEYPLVRFSAAEALAYLGCPAGVDVLGQMAEQHPQVRAYCFLALASIDEVIAHARLTELLASANPEVRYAAFRALQLQDEQGAAVQGELLNDTFWVHRVAPESTPLVHVALQRRPEIVLFGKSPRLVPPFNILVGKEYTVTAAEEDTRCTVSRFHLRAQQIQRRQCSLKVEDVLQTLADLEGQYPDVVELLRQVDEQKVLNCPVAFNTAPQALVVEDLAAAGGDRDFLKGPEESPASPQATGR